MGLALSVGVVGDIYMSSVIYCIYYKLFIWLLYCVFKVIIAGWMDVIIVIAGSLNSTAVN